MSASTLRWFDRLVAGATGAFLGLGLGVLVANGDPLSAAVAVALLVAVAAVAYATQPHPWRGALARLVALAFALRAGIAVLLHTGALAVGRGGFITGDDQAYAKLAWGFARWLVGDPQPPVVPPHWANESYLFGTWVYFESAIFLLFGQRVIVAELMNGAFSVLTVLLVFDLARRVFDARAAMLAATVVAFYPSLVLWSALNLKDALALLLITLTLWAVVRFQLRPHWTHLTLAFAILVPMESLRRYIFVGLALVIPAAALVTPRLERFRRLWWSAAALSASAVLLATTQAGAGLGPGLIAALEGQRSAMVEGARTAFADPILPVQIGDTFVVPGSPQPERPPVQVGDTSVFPGPPRPERPAVHVATDARIVVVTAGASPAPQPNVVFVRPGDVVVVGPPEVRPAPAANRRALRSVQLVDADSSRQDLVVTRTVAYLPKGFAYALFAPFPWAAERSLDLLTIPEMLVWYVVVAAAVITVWRARQRWQVLLPVVVFIGGTLTIFALAEGNVGTLYRHRSMIIPSTIALAAPTLLIVGRIARHAFARAGQRPARGPASEVTWTS